MRIGTRDFEIGKKTYLMGILNVTPDSFSDGGQYDTPPKALQRLQEMVAWGADIIDVGAESTRPGAIPLTAAEEQERLRLVLPLLLQHTTVPISLDTYHAETAKLGIAMGVHIINDVWGLQYAPEPYAMAKTVAAGNIPVIIMYNSRATKPDDTANIMTRAGNFLRRSLEIAAEVGISHANIILDPGIGFGTTPEEDLTLLKNLAQLKKQDNETFPLLVGLSRKGFLGKLLDLPPDNRLVATAVISALAAVNGADILRLHAVREIAPALQLVSQIVTKY